MKQCYLCGGRACDTHHVFNGAMKKKSEQYGALIPVCRNCHDLIHNDDETREGLKAEFQYRIMIDNNLTIDEFREIFKKSYI